jgi:hypothetical protein
MSSATSCATFAACLVLSVGCGDDDDGVTYARDVAPLFQDCTFCHRPGAPAGPREDGAVDILNPYAPEYGLVNRPNTWGYGHPELLQFNVVAGNPDESFLMQKIADPMSGMLPADGAGAPMPMPMEPLTEDGEIASIVRWIEAGAGDTPDFRTDVAPIFGNPMDPMNDFGKKCIFCHFEGTPNPPDLSDPFGPNGLVNVTARYRLDKVLVVPGDPASSFLLDKVRAQVPSSDIGAPMPRVVPQLTEEQVGRVRQWILEGARP